MIRSAALPLIGLVATLVAAALLALLPTATPAQALPEPPKTGHVDDGTRIFREILREMQFKPVQKIEQLKPDDCILIMLGDTAKLTDVPGGLTQFLQQGGAAFIASDKPMQPTAQKMLVDATGVSITGYFLSDDSPVINCYRGWNYCPFVESRDPRFMPDPKTGKGLGVATNMPSTLQWATDGPVGVEVFATLPKNLSWLPKMQDNDPVAPLFAAAGDVGKGRVIVLADHSIFIDEMMKPADNNNVEFTANCLAYLRGEHKQRQRVLFVDDGFIRTSFEKSPKISLPNKIDNFINEGNQGLNEWQSRLNEIDQDDGFNKRFWNYLSQNDREGVRRFIMRLLALSTLALVMYACYRLGIVSRYKKEPSVPALARVAGQQGPRGSLLEQRLAGLLDAQNLWEAGRQLARDAFEAGGVAAPVPYREPAVKLRGVAWWRGFGQRRRVLELWRLAFLNKPMQMAPHAIRALVAELEQLKANLKRGTIQVT